MSWPTYWLTWFTTAFLTFLGPEIYALVKHNKNTLSETLWHFERFQRGQPVWQWTAAHFLITGVLALVFVWLLGHFALGWWR